MYKHSIVIPTLHTAKDIAALLHELQTKSTGKYELIITSKKVSAAKNRNIGLNKTTTDYIIMIDDDIKDMPYGWNEEMIRPLIENEEIKMVSARLLNTNGDLGVTMSGNYNIDEEIATVANGCVPTACVAFKKTELRFDETYVGSGFEDTDFCYQMMNKFLGAKHVINNNVKLVHINEQKNQQGENWKTNEAFFKDKWKDFKIVTKNIEIDKTKTVSLCMIAKDEAAHIARALNSAKGLVDEIIVVDTGSSDRTIEIAKECGAKIFEHPWQGSFAEARNFAAEQATSDWILFIDADEEIVETTREDIQELMSIPTEFPVIFAVNISNIMDRTGTKQILVHHMGRFYTNNKGVRYKGRIHEVLRAYDNDGNEYFIGPTTKKIKIMHYGYMEQIFKEKDKGNRNINAMLKELEEDEKNAFLLYHLAKEFRVNKRLEEAITYFQKWHDVVSLGETHHNVELPIGYASYVGTLLELDRHKEALTIGQKTESFCLNNPDFVLNYAIALKKNNLFEKGLDIIERAFTVNEDTLSTSYDTTALSWKALFVKGDMLLGLNQPKEALKWWNEAYKAQPNNPNILKNMAETCFALKDFYSAERLFDQYFKMVPPKEKKKYAVSLSKMYFNTGRIEKSVKELLTIEEVKERNHYIREMMARMITEERYDLIQRIEQILKNNEI